MANLRIGLVGLGEISRYFVRGIQLHPSTSLVAVCRRTATLQDRERYSGYQWYTDWKDLVNDPLINCVIIATPPSSHAEITSCALKLHKKVIVEKPFSLQLKDAYDCVELANKQKTHLYFAYHAAFNPLTLKTKQKVEKRLESGDKISSFKVIFKEDVRAYHGANSWIFEPSISGGGCLIDSGINAISIIENILGHVLPTKVHLGFQPDYKVEISSHVWFASDKDSQLIGELEQDWLHTGNEQREVTVNFKSGTSFTFDYATGLILTRLPSGQIEQQHVDQREDTDSHQSPMALEYINIVKDAVEFFEKGENFESYIDSLGIGPFESIMKCYQMAKNKL